MIHLAINEATATWILNHQRLIEALAEDIRSLGNVSALQQAKYSCGPFHIAATNNGKLLMLWNSDYLSGTGDEPWGIIRLTPPYGLHSEPAIFPEVFKRFLHLSSQRLRGLTLDEKFYHRSRGNNIHTCVCGQSEKAFQLNLAYFERDISNDTSAQRSLLVVGPHHDFDTIVNVAIEESKALRMLARSANQLINSVRPRPTIDSIILPKTCTILTPKKTSAREGAYANVTVRTASALPAPELIDKTRDWTYSQWTAPNSPLTGVQRKLLSNDFIYHHPIRIVGPAGSGKTLLMQLLALHVLQKAKDENVPRKVAYLTHNAVMMNNVWSRFVDMGAEEFLNDKVRQLEVTTLSLFAERTLNLDATMVIDSDAYTTKEFQRLYVEDAYDEVICDGVLASLDADSLLKTCRGNLTLKSLIVDLLTHEITTVIKGQGLKDDKNRYVLSERKLSRLHGALKQKDRSFVFDIFDIYNKKILEEFGLLDSDDIALSLLGHLSIPMWQIQRKKLGVDFIFVDETHLFTEIERRVFSFLSKNNSDHVPIVLALDEAQDIQGISSAGFGLLGIDAIQNENLNAVHRSTFAIIKLAFFIIQRSTELFTNDFPDFTGIINEGVPDKHPVARKPIILSGHLPIGQLVCEIVQHLKDRNIWQICIVNHSDQYWGTVVQALRAAGFSFFELSRRGEAIEKGKPVLVVARPDCVGGQEFDAVIAVGLEQGMVPPTISHNEALSAALVQRALREMYLGFTRARYRVIVANSPGTAPSPILQEAVVQNLISHISDLNAYD